LFAVYIDSIICKLKQPGCGSYIGGYNVGCQMHDSCFVEAVFLDLQLNTKKLIALWIGIRWHNECSSIYINEIRYFTVI